MTAPPNESDIIDLDNINKWVRFARDERLIELDCGAISEYYFNLQTQTVSRYTWHWRESSSVFSRHSRNHYGPYIEHNIDPDTLEDNVRNTYDKLTKGKGDSNNTHTNS